jgi:conjugative transfer signal peptidase TraF
MNPVLSTICPLTSRHWEWPRISMSGLHNRRLLRPIVLTAVAILCVIALPALAGLRINTTGSLPVGVYLITNDPHAPLVEFCPQGIFSALSSSRGYRPPGLCADGAAPLLKPVIAHSGDTVVLAAEGIWVNGRLLPNTAPKHADTAGRSLPAWPTGTYSVGPSTLWVASTYHPNSFDSRYFGPISPDVIRHRLRPLWVFGSAYIGH